MSFEFIFSVHAVKSLLQIRPKAVRVIYLARKNLPELIVLAEKASVAIKHVTQKEIAELVGDVNHQGVVAEVLAESASYDENDLDKILSQINEPPFLLILDGVQDPHNLGACLRTANAAGVHAVIAPKDRAVGLTPVVRRVACGAAEVTPFIAVTNLARTMERLKERGIWLYGGVDAAEESIYKISFSGATAIVLGAEGQGLRRLTQEACDYLVTIPMQGTVSSLNVSVACGICLFEVVKSRIKNL